MIFQLNFTRGDIFPNPLDGDCGIFDPIAMNILYNTFNPPMDLYEQLNEKVSIYFLFPSHAPATVLASF